MELFFKIFLALAVLFLLVWFSPTTLWAAVTGAPFVPTPKRVIRKALKIAGLKPCERLYDLGSGTGKVLIIAEREFGAKAVGIEYSRPLVWLSNLNLYLHGIKKAAVKRESFYETDLKSADVIFMFLTPKAFRKLENKLKKELMPGTRVVTFASPLLFWQTQDIASMPGVKSKLYLYVKK